MAISATERLSNLTERIIVWAGTLTVPGTPTFYEQEIERPPAAASKRIGITVSQPDAWIYSGSHPTSGHAELASALVQLDLYWPRPGNGDDPRQIDKAAESIAYDARNLSLSVLDYTNTYASPTEATDARYRVVESPQIVRLPPENDLLRRQVQITAEWIARTDT